MQNYRLEFNKYHIVSATRANHNMVVTDRQSRTFTRVVRAKASRIANPIPLICGEIKRLSAKNDRAIDQSQGRRTTSNDGLLPSAPNASLHATNTVHAYILAGLHVDVGCQRADDRYGTSRLVRSEEHTSELSHSGESRMPSSA